MRGERERKREKKNEDGGGAIGRKGGNMQHERYYEDEDEDEDEDESTN